MGEATTVIVTTVDARRVHVLWGCIRRRVDPVSDGDGALAWAHRVPQVASPQGTAIVRA